MYIMWAPIIKMRKRLQQKPFDGKIFSSTNLHVDAKHNLS